MKTINQFARTPTATYVIAMAKFTDLNGLWAGSFSYPASSMGAVSFTAWIDDKAGALGGTILEPNTFAATPAEELSSSLNGMRSGAEVAFTKVYDPGQGTHGFAIHYAGKANGDFTWIVGRWRIPGDFEWSGPFEMSRQSGTLERAEKQRTVEVVE